MTFADLHTITLCRFVASVKQLKKDFSANITSEILDVISKSLPKNPEKVN